MLHSIITSAEKIGRYLAGMENKAESRKPCLPAGRQKAKIFSTSIKQTTDEKPNKESPKSANNKKESGELLSETIQSGDDLYFLIKPFRENEFGINHWDTVLKNMVSLRKKNLTFLVRGNQSRIRLYAKIPKDFGNYFQNTFYANYPTSDLSLVDPIANDTPTSYVHFPRGSALMSKEFFTKDGTYIDPFTDILALYSNIPKPADLDIFFTFRFKRNFNIFRFLWKYGTLSYEYMMHNKGEEDEDDIGSPKEERSLKTDIYMSLGFSIHGADASLKKQITQSMKTVFSPFCDKGKIKIMPFFKWKGVAFSQAVNFFHIPTMLNFSKGLDYTLYKKLPYPTNLSTPDNSNIDDLTILGTTDYRAEKLEFGIRKEDKLRHVYIVGKTGTGKSTFISNMVRSDMQAGNGLALLDPHGDLVDTVMEHIPSHRINDVILFDVADTDFPIGFNLLQCEDEEEKNRIVSGVVSAFYKLFEHSRGPRLEYILRNVLLSIVEYPNATLMHILRMLVDETFRKEVISHLKDPLVLKFWNSEFMTWQPRQREEAIAPITNKIGQFLSSSIVRNIFGQPNTKLNLRKAMDEGKIILINLSKGKIGEDNAAMIGSLLVTKFQIDAMSRADVGYNTRKDFYLYIDEFQNFATTSFATILSEARKYKLSLIVANQFTNQLLPEVKDAIFGNIGTIISFTLGHDDAAIMSSQFKEIVSINDLISLPKFTAYTKLMIDGISSDPFSMKTMPLATPEGTIELREKILKQSRQRYAQEKSALETLMNAWNKKSFSPQEKVVAKANFESLGLENDEIVALQDPFVEGHINLFQKYSIDGQQADAIVFDPKMKKHKAVWYHVPKGLADEATFVKKMHHIDIYTHNTLQDEKGDPLMILVGDKDAVKEQTHASKTLKFCPNVSKLPVIAQSDKKNPSSQKSVKNTPTHDHEEKKSSSQFTIKDIELGKSYTGYVKLLYNYGIFVTVKSVEGLLHKKYIKIPDGVDWKKYFTIGDKITVTAKEFKEIKGEKKVVWEM